MRPVMQGAAALQGRVSERFQGAGNGPRRKASQTRIEMIGNQLVVKSNETLEKPENTILRTVSSPQILM